MVLRLFALAALLFVVPAPSPQQPAGLAARVSGRVWDGSTGAPLSEVHVSLPDARRSATTGRDGRYLLALDDAWTERDLKLRFDRVGHASEERALFVRAGDNALDAAMSAHADDAASGTAGAQPTAAPTGSAASVQVVGRVWNGPTQAPLPEVQVYLVGENRGALTRSDGTYTIKLDDGWVGRFVTVRIERIGYMTGEQELVLEPGDNTVVAAMVEHKLALEGITVTGTAGRSRRLEPPRPAPTAQVVGRIADGATGAPLRDVQVYVPGSNLGTLSRADGSYQLALGSGWVGREVTLRYERIGLAPVVRSLVIAAGDNRVDVAMQAEMLQLDEIVVAGTAGAARRREVGASVAYSSTAPAQVLPGRYTSDFHTEGYARIDENPFRSARSNALSTFSIDVDRASYANVRRFVREGRRPPVDAVRIEELVNYFSYSDPVPRGDARVPFTVTTEVAPAPWQPAHRLVRIGLRSRPVAVEDLPPSNLVFLIDVSGSMSAANKLPLVKTALRMLVEQLRPQDRVALAVYAGAAGLVLPPTPGSERATVLEAIERLEAGGSTAGGAGLRLAYQVAAEHHMEGGNNRVILATDGDFNVGASSDAEMTRLIEEKRGQGTYLTVLGFGTGNVKDSKMEQIADHGNGNFAYIDSAMEAKKALVTEIGGTLLTVAQDVKIQVEFNPARVAGYRLIGYENRLLANEDFSDDAKDAGELGAGHSVVALYEVVPVGAETSVDFGDVDALRYQGSERPPAGSSPELLFVKVRYKEPGAAESQLVSQPVLDSTREPTRELRFAAAVAAWGMLLRDSKHVGELTLADVSRLARASLGEDPGGYRREFVELVDAARAMELLARAPTDRD